MGAKKAVSLQDVARRAGVSVSTASRVLNTRLKLHLFSEKSIERVRRAAKELGYRANYNAQVLSSGKTSVLGVTAGIRPGANLFELGYFASLMRGVEFAVQESGYEALIINPRGEQLAVDRGREHFHQRRIDGLINLSWLDPTAHERLLADRDVPCVLVEDFLFPSSLPVLTIDYEAALTEVVRHLATTGHRRVLWLGPDAASGESVSRREKAFTSAAWNAGIQGACCRFKERRQPGDVPRFIVEADEALAQHLSQNAAFTAVVCYNDCTAAGAYRGIARVGRQVGQDIAVTGFDNDPGAQFLYPGLTTVDPELHKVGHRAAAILIEMIAKPEAADRFQGHQESIKPRLVVRDSTMPVPNG